MRISRKKRPQKALMPYYRVNEKIRIPEVRVLDLDKQNLGVMTIADALAKAKEQEMDLVEINPKAEPPVVQILDFSHFKYQKEKEVRKQKANSHVSDLKGIRLSIRISDHDLEVRKNQAEKFLDRGDKVKVEIILRGAERNKTNFAFQVIDTFFKRVQDNTPIRYEQATTRQGNKITAVIAKK